ncbi:MAG: MFS transporter [Nitrososphaeria archaeon]
MPKTSNNNDSSSRQMKLVYTRSILSSAQAGAGGPFTGIFAVTLGATPEQIDLYTAVLHLAANAFQFIWGALSDRLGKRIPLIIIGGVASSLLWIPTLATRSVNQFLGLAWTQSFLGSMTTPTWTALIGDVVPPAARGLLVSSINFWSSAGSLAATAFAGAFSMFSSDGSLELYQTPFLLAAALGVAASLAVLPIREARRETRKPGSKPSVMQQLKNIRRSRDLARFLWINALFGFFMSISWPLFSITLVKIVDASLFEVALASVLQGVLALAVQRWTGVLLDRVGRIQVLAVGRASLIIVPLVYAFSGSVPAIILFSALFSIPVTFVNTALMAYLIDVTQIEGRASYIAIYNAVMGGSFFFGTLTGGFLVGYLQVFVGLALALQLVYVLSAGGRLLSGLYLRTMKEKTAYPSTMAREFKNLGKNLRGRLR